MIDPHRISREASQGRELTGGVLALRSLFSLSVNPCIRELPPTTITLLYKLCNQKKNGILKTFLFSEYSIKAPTICFPDLYLSTSIFKHMLFCQREIRPFLAFASFFSYVTFVYFIFLNKKGKTIYWYALIFYLFRNRGL